MKTSKLLILICSFVLSISAFGQKNIVTDTIKVQGNCEMCKSKIEKAAKVQGVTKAEWDVKTKKLVLAYDNTKVKNLDVQKKIAAVGYDTEKVKADDKTYKSLPGCCQYERMSYKK